MSVTRDCIVRVIFHVPSVHLACPSSEFISPSSPVMLRRNRILVKPNIAKAAKPVKATEQSTISHAPIENEADSSAVTVTQPASQSDPLSKLLESSSVVHFTEEVLPAENNEESTTDATTVDPGGDDIDPLSPVKRVSHIPVDNKKLFSPKGGDRFCSDFYEPNLPRPRKKFTGKEELDPKKMRMMDMIYWNPKKEKGMTRRHVETESIVCEEKESPSKSLDLSITKVAAPQVKLGPDGKLVLDETSLVIAEGGRDESVWETIDEDRVTRKVTSMSFRTRAWRKGTVWSEKETELFYEILRCTGPDFGLMHEFFPTRARNELKSKYNREERANWDKLKEVMSRPALLDEDLYEKAANLQKEIEEEALAKKLKRMPVPKEKKIKELIEKVVKEKEVGEGKKKKRKRGAEQEWNEATADLVGEAEEIIRALERERFRTKRKRRTSSNKGSESSEDGTGDADESSSSEEELEPRKSERIKKLSSKAQELLNMTVGVLGSSVTHAVGQDGETTTPSGQVHEGYDEGSDHSGEASEIDLSHVASSSKYLVRERRAPRITKTTTNIGRPSSATGLNLETQFGYDIRGSSVSAVSDESDGSVANEIPLDVGDPLDIDDDLESTDSAESIAVDPDFVPPMSRAAMKRKKRKSKKHRKGPRKSEGSDSKTKPTTTNEPGSEVVSGEATDGVVASENQPTSSSVVEEHVAATDATEKSTVGGGSAPLSSEVPRAAWRGKKPLSVVSLPSNTKRVSSKTKRNQTKATGSVTSRDGVAQGETTIEEQQTSSVTNQEHAAAESNGKSAKIPILHILTAPSCSGIPRAAWRGKPLDEHLANNRRTSPDMSNGSCLEVSSNSAVISPVATENSPAVSVAPDNHEEMVSPDHSAADPGVVRSDSGVPRTAWKPKKPSVKPLIRIPANTKRSTPSTDIDTAVTSHVPETSGCDAARDVAVIDEPSPVDLEDRSGERELTKGSTPQRRSVPSSSSSATLQRKMRSSQPLINKSTKPKSGSKRKDNSTNARSPEVSDDGATQIIVLDDESSSADDCDDTDKSTGSSALEKGTSPSGNVVGTVSKVLPRKRPSRAVVNHAAVGSKESRIGSVEKPSSEAEVGARMEASGAGSDAAQGPSLDPPGNVEESTAEQEAASNETSRKQLGQASIQQGELVLKRERRVMKRARVSLRPRR